MPTSTTWLQFKRHHIPTARSFFHICPGSALSYSVGRQQKLKRRFVTSSYIPHCFTALPIDDKVWRDSFAHAESWFNTWRISCGLVIYFELRHRKPNFYVEPFLFSTLMKMHILKKANCLCRIHSRLLSAESKGNGSKYGAFQALLSGPWSSMVHCHGTCI